LLLWRFRPERPPGRGRLKGQWQVTPGRRGSSATGSPDDLCRAHEEYIEPGDLGTVDRSDVLGRRQSVRCIIGRTRGNPLPKAGSLLLPFAKTPNQRFAKSIGFEPIEQSGNGSFSRLQFGEKTAVCWGTE